MCSASDLRFKQNCASQVYLFVMMESNFSLADTVVKRPYRSSVLLVRFSVQRMRYRLGCLTFVSLALAASLRAE